MNSKKWFKSKGIVAGVILVLISVYNAAGSSLASGCVEDPAVIIEGVDAIAEGLCYNLPVIPEWVFGILGALGIYGRASATTTIK